jgi:hypothetical protein
MFAAGNCRLARVKDMIVFVAGMQRSGSTFCFNVVREVLSRRGKVFQKPSNNIDEVYADYDGADHVILKAHSVETNTFKLIQSGAMKVVCTVRRPEDAIASWMETFNFSLDESIDHMRSWIEGFERILPYALVIPYEEIDRYPRHSAGRIAKHICSDASFAEIRRIARLYSKGEVKRVTDSLAMTDQGIQDLGFSYYDDRTFFHRRHVSSLISRPAAERIGSASVSQIRDQLRHVIRSDGHLTITPPVAARPAFLNNVLAFASF